MESLSNIAFSIGVLGSGERDKDFRRMVQTLETQLPQFLPFDSSTFSAIDGLVGLAVEFQWAIMYNLQMAITLTGN